MFLEVFKNTGVGVAQIVLLGVVGFLLVKSDILKNDALHFLSRLVVEVALPAMIFCQLIKNFSFSAYNNWWIFPLLSLVITLAGFLCGALFSVFIKGNQRKIQFLSLSAFQNAAYLPLVLVAALLSGENLDKALIYLFLFLLGFNAVLWSFGVYILTFTKEKKFQLNSLFSPPVIAIIASLFFIYIGLDRIIPVFVIKPFKMIGDCTVPLAMFVVAGNLAEIELKHIDKKAAFLTVLSKLILLPFFGLLLVLKLNVDCFLGALIIMQLAMPPATSLSVIMSHHKKEDLLISHGVFIGHIASIITAPVFLSLYFYLAGWPGCVK